ncbi:hypothetical protein ABZ484_28760 [Streptomyces sp. NPDC006393]|uniref:hypothetical protein n=1 Tax=Streptomyces sp. NPDC006393 TaxID=3156763 RepID=UPI0033F4AF2A
MNYVLLSVNVTPAGIPVIGVVVIVALLALFVWDALRLPAGAWFRWLIPVGFLPLIAGMMTEIYWMIALGAVVMGLGLAMGKGRRQRESLRRRL